MSVLLNKETNKILANIGHNYNFVGGLKFDGVNDYVDLASLNNNIQFNSLYSFSIWAKPITYQSGFNTCPIFCKCQSFFGRNGFNFGIAFGFGFYVDYIDSFTGNRKFYICDLFLPQFNLGVIVHIVYNNQSKTLFVNGVATNLNLNINIGSEPVYANYPLKLGILSEGEEYRGMLNLYDLKIFDKELTQQEALHLFKSKSQSLPSTASTNLIANYLFKDAQGFNLVDNVSANNGTLTNYTLGDVSFGVNNSWLGTDDNPYNP